MKPEDFEFMAALLRERSGLVLSSDKTYLLESRLIPVARKRGLKGLDGLADTIRRTRPEPLIRDVIDAMTTNESCFFRDIKPFDLFRDNVIPHLLAARADKKFFRIWCAAASTGQEPYSLAIILREQAARLAGWKCEIVGTDLSREVLERAKKGLYSQFEVQRGLPIRFLVKYFEKKEDQWQIKPEIRGMVQYRELNLLHDPNPLGAFDVVFCRNVLIYFDQPTKERILENISKLMPRDGMLFLGGAETILGGCDKFKPLPGQRGVYCQTGAPAGIGTVKAP
ncbi:MAG: protein-glutamate O-methyltransferase CheR [Rhodospirillales bacterium]|nr:protein-glutamate O-methyltransferase CheR [Rhodospirillales bacterium]